METNKYKELIEKSPVGFALHRIIFDDNGQPVDCEYVAVNVAFEKLSGLKSRDIIGRPLTELLPEIKVDPFDWFTFYSNLAQDGTEVTYNYFSKALSRWYAVQAFSTENEYFAEIYFDITEQKLTEQRFQGLVESQNDMIVRVDTNNRFTFVNKAYCKAFGKKCDQLIGSDFFPLIHPDDRESTARALELLKTPPYRCYIEQRALTVNGWRWLAWEDNAIRDEAGNIIEVQGVGRDITELKNKEKAIIKQAASLQNLLSHTPAVIYSYSFKNGIPDIHYINENVEQVLGFKPAEFLHNFEMWSSCVHPEDIALLAGKLKQPNSAGDTGKIIYNEYRFRDKAGQYHWLSDRQKVILNDEGEIEIVGAWVDITRDKEAANELLGYKKRLSLAQNFAKAGSWEYNIENDRLYWSPECEELFGLETGSFEGTFEAFLQMVHPDDRAEVIKINSPITERKEGVPLEYEHRIVLPTGEIKWVKETAGIYDDSNGKAQLIIGLVMDITQRKLAEEALENEKKLRDIVDNIEGVFWLRSADRQVMLYVSPAYELIFGMAPSSLYENPSAFVDLVHPDDKKQVQEAYAGFLQSGRFNMQYRIVRPDGAMRWIDTKAFPVRNQFGEVIRYAGISEDITRRRETEQSEKEKTNNLNATIAALPDMLFFISKDGTYLDIYNADPEKLFAPKEDAIGRNISDFFDEEQSAEIMQLFSECIGQQQLKTYDYSIVVGGQKLYFEARLSPVDDQKLLAIVRDVTDRKQYEENLKRQTQLQKLLVGISNTYIGINEADLDKAINNSLAELGAFMGADRCYIFEHDYERKVTNNTYEWCAEGIEPQLELLQGTPFSEFPEWLETNQKGETLTIHDVLKLPLDSSIRSILEPQGIKSLIAVPIMNGKINTGFIGFDAVLKRHVFDENEEQLLRVFAKMLVSVKKRIAAEKAIAESERKFYTAFMTSPYAMMLTRPNDGSFVEVNQAFTDISGYTRDEALNSTSIALNLWDNPNDREKMIGRLKRKGSVNSEEYRFRNKLGKMRFGLLSAQLIELNGEKIVLTSINDITEKKRADEIIWKNEERFRQVAETNQTVIWETDKAGFFTYVSPMAASIWGYEPEELLYKMSYFNLHPFIERESDKAGSLKMLQEDQSFRDVVNQIQKPDGSAVWVSSNGHVIINCLGDVVGYRGSDQDVTEQKLLFEELTQAKEKAVESDRLKSSFLATISHELRTPLNHVMGYSQLILGSTLEEETKSYAEVIYKSGSDFLNMIEDIFDLAFMDEAVKIRNVSFIGAEFFMLAKNCLIELLDRTGKSDQIRLSFMPDERFLEANVISDNQKIMLVLTHLFKNAVKFTEEGVIEFGMLREHETEIVFYVKDTGIGMVEDVRETIFDAFRQVEETSTRNYDGLGIGLAISKKVADALGATITLDSEPGEGSTFYLNVPVEMNIQPENQGASVEEEHLDRKLQQQTILIAEDNPNSRLLMEKMLKEAQIKYISASNGQEAVKLFRENPEISMVLMDLKMPELDGYEATKQIKLIKPEVPVIALTAYVMESEKQQAFAAGCNATVSKPVKRNILFNEIRQLIR